MPCHPKTSYAELSLCARTQPPLSPQGSAGEEGEGRMLGAMRQPPQGDVAGEGFAVECCVCWFKVSLRFFPLGQHDPTQGFSKVVATRHS